MFARRVALVGLLICQLGIGGCALLMGPQHDQTAKVAVSQSALSYLYPKNSTSLPTVGGVSRIELPLRVGVGFIPQRQGAPISAVARRAALQDLADFLGTQSFISQARVLPLDALTQSGGYTELEGLAHMYQVDAMVLIGYDQIAYSEDSPWALLDLTVLGAFVLPAHKQDMQTHLTATALHVPSKRFLFSADAVVTAEQHSTWIAAAGQIRHAQAEALTSGTQGLKPALESSLQRFKQTSAEDKTLDIAGGSFPPWLAVMALFGFVGLRRNRSC